MIMPIPRNGRITRRRNETKIEQHTWAELKSHEQIRFKTRNCATITKLKRQRDDTTWNVK